MGLDGLDGDEQLLGHLFVLIPPRDEAHDLPFAGRKAVEFLIDLGQFACGSAECVEGETREARAENRVTVGDLQADNVEAVIIPEGLDVSLLGQSFLSQVENVQIEGDRMTLN